MFGNLLISAAFMSFSLLPWEAVNYPNGEPVNAAVSKTLPCMKSASSSTIKPKVPVAVAAFVGNRKLFSLTAGDPALPSSAKPEGGDVLGDQVDKQNANNPVNTSAPITGGSTSHVTGSNSQGSPGGAITCF